MINNSSSLHSFLSKEGNIPQQTSKQELISKSSNSGKWWKRFMKIDIFYFRPFPRTNKISTVRTQTGSLLLISIFSSFVIWTSFSFIFTIAPTLNTFNSPISNVEQYECPDFAFGFFQIDESTTTTLILDSSLFTYSISQFDSQNAINQQIDYEICSPDWGPIDTNMLCPTKKLYLQSQYGIVGRLQYPKVEVIKCSELITPGIQCQDQKAIDLFPKGRFIIFIRKNSQGNNPNSNEGASGTFKQFFIVPELFQRGLTTFYLKKNIQYPNYFSSYQNQQDSHLNLLNSFLYTSEVSSLYTSDQPRPLFLWEAGLDGSQENQQITPKTLADLLSLWGGMWSVMLALFSIIYLSYNSKQFYSLNKHWERFDKLIQVNRLNSSLSILELQKFQNSMKLISSSSGEMSQNVSKASDQKEKEDLTN